MLLIIGLTIYIGVFIYALYLAFRGFSEADEEYKSKYDRTLSDLEKLRLDLGRRDAEISVREQQKELLSIEISRLQAQQKTDAAKVADANAKDLEIKRLNAEVERVAAIGREAPKLNELLQAANQQVLEYKKKLEQVGGDVAFTDL